MSLKSERLKKLENELADLEHWLKLGLVPKKDIIKHEEEIVSTRKKIDDEKQRLRFLKESGEVEEFAPPKRSGRSTYQEPQSMPDLTLAEEGMTEEGGFDMETESYETETGTGEETAATETGEEDVSSQVYEDDEDPYSDRNRWKRGVLENPDHDEW